MTPRHPRRPLHAALSFGLLLTAVPSTFAYIDLFLSRDGVQNYALDTAARDYLPYFPYLDPSYPRPAPIPFGTQLSGAASLEAPFFLWGRFVNEPAGSMLYGMWPAVWTAEHSNVVLGLNTVYRHQKRNGLIPERWVRWDATQPISVNQPFGAATTNGIINTVNPFDLVCREDPNNGGAIDFLIGAFDLDGPVPGTGPPGVLYLGLGIGGAWMATPDDHLHHYLPEVRLGGAVVQEYVDLGPCGTPGTPTIYPPPGPYLTFNPEPGTVASAVTLVCLVRRRR
jgi:hypothetical protein